MVENSKDAIAIVDFKGNILFANKAAERLTGYSAQEGKGINIRAITPRRLWLKSIAMLLKARLGKTIPYFEYELKRKDGTLIPVETGGQAIFKDGKPVAIQIITRDITERKKAEEDLMKSEEKFRSLTEATSDWVWEVDQHGVYTYASPKVLDLLGYEPEEIIGKTPFDLMPPDEAKRIAAEFGAIVETKKPFDRLENVNLHKDGHQVVLETSGVPILDASGNLKGYRGIDRDITERKRMEDELRRYSEHLGELVEERTKQLKGSQEQLLKAERLAAIGEVATMVGHDLRNPLQAITNAVYFLKNPDATVDSVLMNERYKEYFDIMPEPIRNEFHEKLTKTVKVRNEMINTIDESIEYADKIVFGLQDFARPKEPEPIRIGLESLIQESLSGISIPKNVKISIKHDQRLSKLYVDPNQIRRVFANLTMNAIQAMENGGTLSISTNKTNGFLEVSFKDTGVGIPEENMEKIFSTFFTTKAKGMGLGLSICKKFVELHGGTIKVESEIGKGTTVTVKLPITKENGGEKT